jgi:signal transduction histidine kinase
MRGGNVSEDGRGGGSGRRTRSDGASPGIESGELERLARVGQLVRPLAHGLNNALMVATGNLEFVRGHLAAAGLPTEEVDEIEEALDRAAGLVRQLRDASRAR